MDHHHHHRRHIFFCLYEVVYFLGYQKLYLLLDCCMGKWTITMIIVIIVIVIITIITISVLSNNADE